MPSAQATLKGKVQWLLLPPAFTTTPVGFATVYYCYKTFDLPTGTIGPIIVLAILAFAILGPLANWLYSRGLKTLDDVGASRAPANKANLGKIAQEISALPDLMLGVIIMCWVGGVIVVVLATHLYTPAFTLRLALRVAASALVLAPMGILLSYLVCVVRGRQLLAMLPDLGLTAADMMEALPPKREQLRTRFLIFSAVLLLSPFAITADVAVSTVQRSLGKVRTAQDVAGIEKLTDDAVRDTLLSVAFLGGTVLLFGLSAAYLGGLSIGSPLRELAREASQLAAGDMRQARIVPAEDELWTVSVAFSKMQQQVTAVLAELQRAGLRISSTTEQLLATTSRSEAGATEQAASVHETTATTEELARVARQIAANADTVAKTAEKTLSAAQGGQANSKAFIGSMARMRHENGAMSEAVRTLNQRVQQIVRIVEFINGVADKADLLALNAELEGTKAGDVGRGFSLVATEMRRLAENVMKSTREIEQLIEEIRTATSAAVAATEAGVRATESGATLAQQVSEQLERILALATDTSSSATAISLATQQQQTSSGQLAEAMTRVLQVTDQNVSSTKQVASSSTDLASLARELKGVVERFRVS